LPAIFTGEQMKGYRQWLSAAKAGSLGGSLLFDDITDYYLTPFELGYGKTVKFDHDFVGREALEGRDEREHRTKVTLVWNADDVASAFRSMFSDGPTAKYIDLPKSRYALYQMDTVLDADEPVGISLDCGYIANESAFVSLACVDAAHAQAGTEVTVIWGEEPNSAKPQVEPHTQMPVRATVAPVPYVEFARSQYRAPSATHSR
jgi:glycine cleavage system aminomethyltransferase T